MAIFTIAFGAVPYFTDFNSIKSYCFLLLGFSYGCGSTLAEAGSYALLASSFPDRIGSVLARAEMFTGFGTAVGPFVGGALYDVAAQIGGDRVQFALPFLIASVVPIVLVPICLALLPAQATNDEEEYEEKSSLSIYTPTVLLDGLATMLSAIQFGALNPTLSIKLARPPFHASPTLVGAIFLVAGVTYILGSIPLGHFIDRPAIKVQCQCARQYHCCSH
jgi:MFS family permease